MIGDFSLKDKTSIRYEIIQKSEGAIGSSHRSNDIETKNEYRRRWSNNRSLF